MSFQSRIQRFKPWMMPIAILGGFLFHGPIARMQWVIPYLIFSMLFITFCRVKPRDFRIDGMICKLLAVQLFGALILLYVLRPLSLTFAQSMMVCILCPTATAAPVVTGMLGGSIARVAAYSIVSNLATALLAPLLFVFAAPGLEIDFFREFSAIALHVAPMIVFPLGLALLLYFIAPRAHNAVAAVQGVSFYLWSVSLFLVVGRAVSFALEEPASAVPLMLLMALGALLLCLFQFYVGRRVGRAYGDPVSAAQGLGQKNTVLAIWMSLSYLNPLSSIGPAAYIVWQNTINSLQLYFKVKRDSVKDGEQ